MSVVGQSFIAAFGPPDPPAPSGLTFQSWAQRGWDRLYSEIGAGWYLDGFLYLFGEGLAALQPCLEAWSFLIPPCSDRRILGRNAYGAILVIDNSDSPEGERVYILDPFTVTYDGAANWQFINLIGRALPQREMPTFLDNRPYDAWRKANAVDRLDLDDVLGIKVPKALGGKLAVENLQLDNIVSYYQTTAPIYEKAFASIKLDKEA
jgi:hypothetical protein